MEQYTIVRPCGLLEQFSTSRHSLGIYRCVTVTCRYSVPEKSAQNQSLGLAIRQAVAQVVLQQPFMRVGIVREDTKEPCYVHLETIDISQQVEVKQFPLEGSESQDAVFVKQLEHQHDQLWPNPHQRAPWKVIVLPLNSHGPGLATVDVVYAWHHAIGDGLSGGIFHSQLLEALNNPAARIPGLSEGLLQFTEAPTLPLPNNQLLKLRIGWLFFLGTLWQAFAPSWLQSKRLAIPWTGGSINFSLPYETNVRLVSISSSTVSKLLQACRVHSVTLTPVVHALVSASLARRLPVSEAPALASNTAISVRRYVPPDTGFDTKRHMSVLVTSAEHALTPDLVTALRENGDSSIWRVANQVHADLKDKVAELPTNDITAMLKYVGDFHAWWREKDGKQRDSAWEVSNLGTINGGDVEGGWKAVRAVFAQSAAVAGTAMSVNVAGVIGGEVSVTLTWQEGIVDNTLMDGLAADLGAWTKQFGNDGTFRA